MSPESPQGVRIAVIGVGNMGFNHAKWLTNLPNIRLAAVCDIDKERADYVSGELDVDAYYSHQELFEKADIDAVLVATPHYSHVPISLDALEKGLHILVEKPIAVQASEAKRLNAAAQSKPDLVYAEMFMQRTYGYWRKIKSMIDDGELGKLVRVTWIITDWFRTQAYYNRNPWRATWEGEGGGVLMNQSVHNLDLYQWMVGMPVRVRGFASPGKYHNIEVEDEVTAYFEHANGMVGHFITSTGESPGTNRLEIVGELGKLIYEDDTLTFYRNNISMLEQIHGAATAYEGVKSAREEIAYDHHGESGHARISANFADAILNGSELVAPGSEGLQSVMLTNAITYSYLTNQMVDVPVDDATFDAALQRLIDDSREKA